MIWNHEFHVKTQDSGENSYSIGVGSKELLEWAPKSYWSGLQRAIGVGSKELKEAYYSGGSSVLHPYGMEERRSVVIKVFQSLI